MLGRRDWERAGHLPSSLHAQWCLGAAERLGVDLRALGAEWEARGRDIGTVTECLNGFSELTLENPQTWESCPQVTEKQGLIGVPDLLGESWGLWDTGSKDELWVVFPIVWRTEYRNSSSLLSHPFSRHPSTVASGTSWTSSTLVHSLSLR